MSDLDIRSEVRAKQVIRRSLTAGTALIALLSADCGTDTSAPKAGPAARVEIVTSLAVSTPVASGAGTFSVRVADASGLAVEGVNVAFSSTSGAVTPAAISTGADGIASTQLSTGSASGSVTVTARATGVALPVAQTIAAVAGPVTRIAVAPKTVRLVAIGDTARVLAAATDQYANAAARGALTFTSVDASVADVDTSGLVTARRQGGSTFVIVSANGRADTTVVTVLAAGASICDGLATEAVMAVGDVRTYSGVPYGCVSGTALGAEFTVVAFNGSNDPDVAISASLMGNGVGPAPSTLVSPANVPALRSATGAADRARPSLDENFHLRLLRDAKAHHPSFAGLRASRRLLVSRSVAGVSSASAASVTPIPATVQPGDLVSLNVSPSGCTPAETRALRVEAVGTKSIVLADTLNPTGGFTDADYQRIAVRFDTLVYPLDVDAFGAPSDIDANGRVAIIFTRVVNEMVDSTTGYFVGGFFNPRDLYPKVGARAGDNCAGSNEGEMFYMLVPAPDGIRGVKHTTGFVDTLTTSIVAHEFQHLINASRRMYVNNAALDYEAVWLNEGLSHIAEELLYYRESGFKPRQNLDDNTIRVLNRPLYGIFKSDEASNFSRLLTYLKSPSGNSPYANNDDLATRGATWSFLRYAADHLGSSDGTIWQRFGNSTSEGLETLRSVFATDPLPLVRDWSVANALDDAGVTTDVRFMHPSWNFRDIFTHAFVNVPTFPLPFVGLTDGVQSDFAIIGGSAAYARFAVSPSRDGLLAFSSGGGTPNGALQFFVVRTK